MNRWFWRTITLAIAIAAGVWLFTLLFPNPERVIRKRLTALAECLSFGANEAPLTRFSNSQKVAGFFTADIEIHVDVPGYGQQVLAGREGLFQTTMQARSSLNGLKVEFLDINVVVAPNKASAEVEMTLKARIASERDLIVKELKVLLDKSEGNWRIKRVETVKTLS